MQIDHRTQIIFFAPLKCMMQQRKSFYILFPIFSEHLFFINRNTYMIKTF